MADMKDTSEAKLIGVYDRADRLIGFKKRGSGLEYEPIGARAGQVEGFPIGVGADSFGRRGRRLCKLFGVPNENTPASDFGATAGSGVTFHDRLELESRATRIALIYGNTAGTPQTISGVKAFTHQDFTNELANEVIGSFDTVTFSGAASVTIPAGSAGQASMVVSDWINLKDNPRLDGVQRTNLHVRTMWATPAANEPITSINRAGAVWTSSPRVSKTSYQPGNRLTSAMTPAAGTSAESRTVLLGVLYEIRGKGMTIMLIGDSTTSGYFGPSSTVRRRPWVHRLALALSTPTNPVDFIVCGIGGENVPSYCAMAEKLFALGVRPSLVFLHTLSPNLANIGGYTSANIADVRGWVTRIMDQVSGMGGCTVLMNGAPASNLGLTNDNTRKSLNTQWVDYDQYVMDIDSVLSNGATPALLRPEYSEDGIHYSEAGDAVIEALAMPLARAAVEAYFR